jgi:hypothetical protein
MKFRAKQPGGVDMQKRITLIPSLIVFAVVMAACNPSLGTDTPTVPTPAFPSETATPSVASASLPCNILDVLSISVDPKDAVFAPNAPFRATFQLKNSGSCDWDTGYRLIFDHGERMGFSNRMPLSAAAITPGSIRDLSVPLIAPEAEGTHQAFFKLRASDGTVFGTGPRADTAFGVTITVLNRTAIAQSYTPTSTSTPTPVITLPTPTADYSNAPFVSIKYVADVTVPDGWEVGPDTVFTKTWRLENDGRMTISGGSSLVFDHGDRLGAPLKTGLTLDKWIESGENMDISVDLMSPSTPGTYQAFFKIFVQHGPGEANGSFAERIIWVKIRVIAPTPVPSGTPKIRTVSTRVTVAPGADGFVAAPCPSGTVVTGGGFSMANTREELPHFVEGIFLDVDSMRKQGNGWKVQGTNYGDQPVVLTAYAVCLADPSAQTAEVKAEKNIPAKGGGTVTVNCPKGSVITGGGYDAQDTDISESGPAGDAWRIRAVNNGNQFAPVSAYAVCLSGVPAKSAYAVASKCVQDYQFGYVAAECPAGSALTGGGFINEDAIMDEVSAHGQTWVVHGFGYYATHGRIVAHAACLAYA